MMTKPRRSFPTPFPRLYSFLITTALSLPWLSSDLLPLNSSPRLLFLYSRHSFYPFFLHCTHFHLPSKRTGVLTRTATHCHYRHTTTTIPTNPVLSSYHPCLHAAHAMSSSQRLPSASSASYAGAPPLAGPPHNTTVICMMVGDRLANGRRHSLSAFAVRRHGMLRR
jgi:hypothetical protein